MEINTVDKTITFYLDDNLNEHNDITSAIKSNHLIALEKKYNFIKNIYTNFTEIPYGNNLKDNLGLIRFVENFIIVEFSDIIFKYPFNNNINPKYEFIFDNYILYKYVITEIIPMYINNLQIHNMNEFMLFINDYVWFKFKHNDNDVKL